MGGLAQFASNDCPSRMNCAGSSLEAFPFLGGLSGENDPKITNHQEINGHQLGKCLPTCAIDFATFRIVDALADHISKKRQNTFVKGGVDVQRPSNNKVA